MDLLEELTTRMFHVALSCSAPSTSPVCFVSGQADVILANSLFTVRVFRTYFPSINFSSTVVHPGINISAYEVVVDQNDPDVAAL
jgi:hypothetical protein